MCSMPRQTETIYTIDGRTRAESGGRNNEKKKGAGRGEGAILGFALTEAIAAG